MKKNILILVTGRNSHNLLSPCCWSGPVRHFTVIISVLRKPCMGKYCLPLSDEDTGDWPSKKPSLSSSD